MDRRYRQEVLGRKDKTYDPREVPVRLTADGERAGVSVSTGPVRRRETSWRGQQKWKV